jgi:hypothetical protein
MCRWNAFTYDCSNLDRIPPQTFTRFDTTLRPGSGQARGLPRRRRPSSTPEADTRRKIVDVFTVKFILPNPPEDSIWQSYTSDLHHFLRMMRTGQRREARGELAVRVGQRLKSVRGRAAPLLPIEIEIDNEADEHYTILRIDTQTRSASCMNSPMPWR